MFGGIGKKLHLNSGRFVWWHTLHHHQTKDVEPALHPRVVDPVLEFLQGARVALGYVRIGFRCNTVLRRSSVGVNDSHDLFPLFPRLAVRIHSRAIRREIEKVCEVARPVAPSCVTATASGFNAQRRRSFADDVGDLLTQILEHAVSLRARACRGRRGRRGGMRGRWRCFPARARRW